VRSKQISGFPRSPWTSEKTAGSVRRLFHMSAVLAENERDVIREHPIAGLASARARGRKAAGRRN
jgi:DNA invertase Pin-like site-specific DNA recombinase